MHIEVHVYRLGFVKPYSNEMDEVILRRILLYISLKMKKHMIEK